MPPTYFKFTSPEGLNRRLTFSEPPTWPLLAAKLHVLYDIPLDNVGVSYVDNDNDEITLSSDEELQDFYKLSHQSGQVIKFAVVDLHSAQNSAGKPLEFPSLSRNPFDGDAYEFVGEWERFPPALVTEEDISKSGPHAFVEVLSSNNSVVHDHTHEMDTDMEDDHSTAQPPLLNKGKGRAQSFGAASITSVLGEEISYKHPIHVYDLNSRRDDKGKDNSFDVPSVQIHVAAQSTPKVQVQNVDDNRDTEEIVTPVEVEDPPLPSLDESPASATSPSLFHDLASLVHDVTQVVSSHPELSEGLRNIGRNINNRTYWATHPEALSNATNGMSNPPSTEERDQAEDAAARRLTDVVGNFFRTLAQVPIGAEDTRSPNINENRSDQPQGENLAHVSPPFPPWYPMNNAFGWAFQGMRSHGPFGPMHGPPLRGSRHYGHFPSRGPFPHEPHTPGSRPHVPHPPPVYDSRVPDGSPHSSRPTPPRPPPFPFHRFPRSAPPPPPPPPHAPPGPSPSYNPSPPTHDHPSPSPPAPETDRTYIPPVAQGHIPPPLPPSVPPPNGNPAPIPGVRFSGGPSVGDRRRSYQGPFLPFVPGAQSSSQTAKPNAQDLRAQVEAAKRIYKAEKERYRQEREQRRQERLARRPAAQYVVRYVQDFYNYF
ncbi:hypothetical protein BYT27DRAFT_6591192 [Phlegmacium glaucopus]|nr:hypothetical protein BYT27DRAFT_6591192 [Phlegmacium glaucopus]